jgi:hypothetical protein
MYASCARFRKPGRPLHGAFIAGFVLAVSGCGGDSTAPTEKLVPVSGKVTMKDGTPLTTGAVHLWPQPDTNSETALYPGGMIDENGNYEVMTSGQKGAPLGKYKITVSTKAPPGPGSSPPPVFDPSKPPPDLSAKYSERYKTELSYDVVEHPAAGAYDLKVDK